MLKIPRFLDRNLPAREIPNSMRLLSTASFINPSRRLEEKVAFITGGASGIGEAMAKLFAREGAKVIIADIQDELGRNLAATLGGNQAEYCHCDVSKESDIADAIAGVMSKHGKLDVMLNNAGIMGTMTYPVTEVEMENFDTVIAVNLRGMLLGTKHAARAMIPAKRGSIICTASSAGMMGLVPLPHSYAISKSGVIGLVKTVASELSQHGIRVNAISPYCIPETPMVVRAFHGMVPELKPGEIAERIAKFSGLHGAEFRAEDIARVAVFLGSEEARHISGHNLVVDGAFSDTKVFNPF